MDVDEIIERQMRACHVVMDRLHYGQNFEKS